MYRPPVVRHLNFTSWFSICSTSFSRSTPGVESRRNLELMEATTSFSASSTDHFRFFFSFRITCGRCQGHTTRPCLPLPREPTVGFVHRRRPRHPQLLLYFSCHGRRDGVVYRIPCGECDAVYIGETGRPVQERMKEHERDVRLARCQTSAVAEHANATTHGPSWNDVKCIDRDPH